MNEPITDAAVWKTLSTVPDPEFGLSIVDLGLVYDVKTNGRDIDVTMTLTSQGCPASGMIFDGVKAALALLPGVGEVRAELVWEPAWTPEMLTPAAREHLGWEPASSEN